jgi:hypothetical protein
MKFIFPVPPNLTNRRSGASHWAVRGREKKHYLGRCDSIQLVGMLPEPPASPLERAIVSSVMYLGNSMDDDNALARHKWPLDWLKTRGFIADDRRTCIKWKSLPDQIIKRDGNYRIEITLEAA